MKLKSFDHRARDDRLLHFIVGAKAEPISLLGLMLHGFGGRASREQLTEAFGESCDVDNAISELTRSGALRSYASYARVTARGARFVADLDAAHEYHARRGKLEFDVVHNAGAFIALEFIQADPGVSVRVLQAALGGANCRPEIPSILLDGGFVENRDERLYLTPKGEALLEGFGIRRKAVRSAASSRRESNEVSPRKARRLPAADRKRRIIESARAVSAASNYSTVSTRDLARAADVSEPTGKLPYSFVDTNEIKRKGRLFFVGHEDLLRAAFALAHRYQELQAACSVLIFGLPGNGKSRFPQVLAYDLVESGLEYCMLWVACGTIASRYKPQEAQAHFGQIRDRYIETTAKPMIVVLDEMDAIATYRSDFPSGATVCRCTLDLLRSFGPARKITRFFIGISNMPGSIEPAILNEMLGMLVDPLSESEAAELLRHEGVEEAHKVMAAYSQLCDQSGARYTGRSIGTGFERVKLFFSEEVWKKARPEELAEKLFAAGGLLPAGAAEEYNRDNSWIVGPARQLLRSLQPRFDQLAEKRLVPRQLIRSPAEVS